jgi:hypothetical protein
LCDHRGFRRQINVGAEERSAPLGDRLLAGLASSPHPDSHDSNTVASVLTRAIASNK